MHDEFHFVIAVLAVLRVTHLIAREDGPWNLLDRFRKLLGSGMMSKLFSCFYCLSLWVALPFAWSLKGTVHEKIVDWLALSGGSILLERLFREPFEFRVEEERQWDAAVQQRRDT